VAYEYRIGKYEVTAGQYCEFLNAVAKTEDKYGLHAGATGITRNESNGQYTYSVPAEWANRPVSYVSWGDAARFANWLHNGQPTGEQNASTTEDGAYTLNGATGTAALCAVTRNPTARWAIPSEDEWYKAAYYNPATGTYYDYPTSSDTLPDNDLIDPDPGNNANWYDDHYSVAGSIPYRRSEVGAFENSESPYGTFDQGGNVWEWNEAIVGDSRGIRGGGYFIGSGGLRAVARPYVSPMSEFNVYGFRVAEVPEPGVMTILSLGSAALLKRRRRALR
jgi:formylglycine-generating enzyme required for sulfatase activity